MNIKEGHRDAQLSSLGSLVFAHFGGTYIKMRLLYTMYLPIYYDYIFLSLQHHA